MRLPSLSGLALHDATATGGKESTRSSSLFGGGGGSGQSQDTARGGTRAPSFSFGRARIHPVPTFPRAPQPPRPTNVASLRAELAALQRAVAEADQVTFEQAQRIFALREQLELARASLGTLLAEHEAYRVALETAQGELQDQLVQVEAGLATALASLEEERRAGRISAEEAAQSAATLRAEAEAMRTERNAARALVQSSLAEAAAARNELRAREAELNDLRQNNEMLARQLAASREDNEELQRAFDVERHRLLATHDKLQSQLASRVQELNGCERRCKDSEAKLTAEKERGDALQEREFELMGELAERDFELARKGAEIQALKKALEDCEEELGAANDLLSLARKQIEELKKKHREALDALDEARAEFEEAKAVAAAKEADHGKRLADAKKKLDDCEKQLADTERRLQQAIQEGKECEARERTKDQRINALLARLDEVRGEVDKHKTAANVAKVALKASQDDSKKLTEDLKRSEARRAALEAEAVVDAAKLAKADKEIADCKRKLEECERKLKECERKLKECERKLEESEEAVPKAVANGSDLKEAMRLLVKAALELSGPSTENRGLGHLEANMRQPTAMVKSIVAAMLDILANGSEGQKVALSKELAQNDFFFASSWRNPLTPSRHHFAQRPNYINWEQALPGMYWLTLQNFLGSTNATDRLAYLDLANMSPRHVINSSLSPSLLHAQNLTSVELQSKVLQQMVGGQSIATMEELVFVWDCARNSRREPYDPNKFVPSEEEVKAVDAQRQILANAFPIVYAVFTRYNASDEALEEETRSFYDMTGGYVQWQEPSSPFKKRSFSKRLRSDVALMILGTATESKNASLLEVVSKFGLKPFLDLLMHEKFHETLNNVTAKIIIGILQKLLLLPNFDANVLMTLLKESSGKTLTHALNVLTTIVPNTQEYVQGTPPWRKYQTKFAATGVIGLLLSILRTNEPRDKEYAIGVLSSLKTIDVAEAGTISVMVELFRDANLLYNQTQLLHRASELVKKIKQSGNKRFADEIEAKFYYDRDWYRLKQGA